MPVDLLSSALGVARAALARRWKENRFRLELQRDGAPKWSHVFERPHYEADFRLLELAGTALVTLPREGAPRVRYPVVEADGTGDGERGPERRTDAELDGVTEAELEATVTAARDAGCRAGLAGALRAEIASACRSRDGRTIEARVRLLVQAPDGPVRAEIDASTGERLAFFVPAFLRGSRSGRPLTRDHALERTTEEEPLPRGAVLARADLEEAPGVRMWRFRYRVSGDEALGQLLVCAHARTGVVAGVSSTVRPRSKLRRRCQRAGARTAVARALPGLLGDGAELVSLVPGALVREGTVQSGWLGTAIARDGRVARVSLVNDEVQAAFAGAWLEHAGAAYWRSALGRSRVRRVAP